MIVKFTSEIHQHIGVVGDNDIDILKPFLKRAKRYVIRYISKAVYDAALTHYLSDDYRNVNEDNYEAVSEAKAILDQLVDKIQDPLIYFAHHLFAPEANVIMSDTGFKVAWSDSHRPAQEWQIQAAVDSLLNSAHELMDDLLDFLNENVDSIAEWDASAEIQKHFSLFINTAKEFSKFYYINESRRLFILFNPLISEAERKHIKPIIGTDLFDEIHDQIKDGDVTEANQDILDLIHPALAFQVIAMSIERLPKSDISNITNFNLKEIKDTAKSNLLELENFITKLNNLTLDEDSQLDEESRPGMNYTDDELHENNTLSL